MSFLKRAKTNAQKHPMTPKRFAITVSAWAIAWFFLYPYINMLLTSLKPHSEIYTDTPTHLPRSWQFGNYIDLWSKAPVAGFLKSSLIISIFATLLVLVISIPAAYYVARNKFRGRNLFLLLVLATQMFSLATPHSLYMGVDHTHDRQTISRVLQDLAEIIR